MSVDAVLAILSRWFHVTAAAVLIGGVFYARIAVPIALRAVPAGDENVRSLLRRAGRAFKIAVHACTLFLLASGAYNAYLNWPAYTSLGPAVGHSLFGLHLLLGLFVLGLLIWAMAPREPRATYLRWLTVALATMLLSVAVASTLKYAREHRTGATSSAVPALRPS